MVSVTNDIFKIASSIGITYKELKAALSSVSKIGISTKEVMIGYGIYSNFPLCTIRLRDGTEHELTFQEHDDWYNTYDYDPGDCRDMEEFKDKLMVAEL